jgi:hypothetical protein
MREAQIQREQSREQARRAASGVRDPHDVERRRQTDDGGLMPKECLLLQDADQSRAA